MRSRSRATAQTQEGHRSASVHADHQGVVVGHRGVRNRSGKDLDEYAGDPADGAGVIQYGSKGGTNRLWTSPTRATRPTT
ncbi:hypothetical protein [Streptomyces sp. NPDC048277]|uniref:hypothetical protein n=1 Tax=Streptomyces sp. NPDC048277 TaxID=3155027 RepID=UPI00340D5EEA